MGPTCQPPFSPLPFFFPLLAGPPPQPRGIRRAPAFSPSFLSPASTPIKAINPPLKSPTVSRFPLAFFTPGRSAGHQWQAAGRPSPSRFAYLPAPLFKLVLNRLRLPLPFQHAYSLARAQFPSAAASGPRRRRRQAQPSVKDHLRRLPSLLFGFTRGSSSSIGCRFASSEPVGAAPHPRRSVARPAAIAKPRRC
jgi:hypothetical protein